MLAVRNTATTSRPASAAGDAFTRSTPTANCCFLNGDALGWRGVFRFPENLKMETEKMCFSSVHRLNGHLNRFCDYLHLLSAVRTVREPFRKEYKQDKYIRAKQKIKEFAED